MWIPYARFLAECPGKKVPSSSVRLKRMARAHKWFRTKIEELFRDGASEMATNRVAATLGIEVHEIPQTALDSADGLFTWFTMMLAFSGDEKARADILDRLDPKPRRVEISGPGGGPVRTATLVGSVSEAARYYEMLEGGVEPEALPAEAGAEIAPAQVELKRLPEYDEPAEEDILS